MTIENISNGTAWHGEQQLDLASKAVLLEGDQLALEDGDQIYIVRFQTYDHHKTLQSVAEVLKAGAVAQSEQKPEVNFDTKESKLVDSNKCPKKKAKRKGEWECIENTILIYTPSKLKSSSLIAGFGLIGTLVKVKDSSKKYTQWTLAFENICDKLKFLEKKGYKIAIFSENLITKKLHLKLLKQKVVTLVRRLGVPIQVFISAENEKMKKPVLGMWSEHAKRNNSKIIDTSRSFYVGCLGGRKKCCAKGDPSNADRLFAVNIGVKFFTPEEYFLGTSVAPYRFPKFNPREPCTFDFKQLVSIGQELIIMVGPPDSGKTWTCKRYIVPAGYVHISINFAIEMLRSKSIVKNFLKQCKSVVIDGMNPSADARKTFINIAKKRCVNVRCFEMQISKEQLAHNRKFAKLSGVKDSLKEDSRILAYDTFYQKPTVEEGFQKLLCVPFAPTFDDPKLNSLYHMFLLPD